MSDRYAVIGNPVAHSQSPQIHAAFAAQTGEDLEYGRILGDLEEFEGDVRDFFRTGGKGLNVTVPFKERAWQLADESSRRAGIARAANTLIQLDDGRIRADNTDGIGLVRDLGTNRGFDFAGKRVLVLGAGGATRGVLQPLIEQHPALLWIANRTAAKAVDLAGECSRLGEIIGTGLDALAGERFDLIVNATSAGLSDRVPDLPGDCLAEGGWTYDMMYGTGPTAFVRWGREAGATEALDGLGMLVEQAAESFLLWRGVRPDTGAVIRALRA
ncbi:MAG: shikimate dehydrogenase [Pseudomonadota bacterium]